MSDTVYTVGYSGFSIDDFINVLQENGITCLIDVRSIPSSQYFLDYNKTNLIATLEKNGIIYRNYTNEFGARQSNRKYYTNDILDFEKFIVSDAFQNGIHKVKEGIKLGYSFAFMCAEKDPLNCHRAIMVGQGFKKAGFNILHIHADKSKESQEELEQRLLDLYFDNRNQMNLFQRISSDDELIQESYRLRNKEIGYKLDNEGDYE